MRMMLRFLIPRNAATLEEAMSAQGVSRREHVSSVSALARNKVRRSRSYSARQKSANWLGRVNTNMGIGDRSEFPGRASKPPVRALDGTGHNAVPA